MVQGEKKDFGGEKKHTSSCIWTIFPLFGGRGGCCWVIRRRIVGLVDHRSALEASWSLQGNLAELWGGDPDRGPPSHTSDSKTVPLFKQDQSSSVKSKCSQKNKTKINNSKATNNDKVNAGQAEVDMIRGARRGELVQRNVEETSHQKQKYYRHVLNSL